MSPPRPHVIVLGGPNGAGKSTAAAALLGPMIEVAAFVNADVIAATELPGDAQANAMEAGRLMLSRIRSLAERRTTFAFETTLASRVFAPWIRGLLEEGYAFDLFFLWLPSADAAVARVKERVRRGGHDVPEETVRRRYSRGLANFFELYRPLATSWKLYDNSRREGPGLVARGGTGSMEEVVHDELWRGICAG